MEVLIGAGEKSQRPDYTGPREKYFSRSADLSIKEKNSRPGGIYLQSQLLGRLSQ